LTDLRELAPRAIVTAPAPQVLFPEARARRRKRWRWIGATLAVAVVAAVLTSLYGTDSPPFARGTASHEGAPQAKTFIAPSDEPAGWRVSYPFAIPAAYPFVEGMATNRVNGSVWILAANDIHLDSGTALFEWSPHTGRLTQYAMNEKVTEIVIGQAMAPMAVAPNGTVWVAFKNRLSECFPTTGRVVVVNLPPVRHGVTAVTATDPLNSGDSIVSLAFTGSGTLVVGRGYATTLQVVDPHTLRVTSIALPPNTVIGQETGGFSDVAVNPSGTDIAVVLNSQPDGNRSTIHALGQYVGGRWYESDAHCQAWGATFNGDELVVTDIDACMAYGTFHPGRGPAVLRFVPKSSIKNYPQALSLANGTVVSVTASGLRGIVNGRQSVAISLGSVWQVFSYPVPPGVTVPPPQFVGISPNLMEWGGANTIWFVPYNYGRIGLISQNAVRRV
jgi:hypothetical protein